MDAAVYFWKFNPVSPLVKPLDFTLNTGLNNRGNTIGLTQLISGEYVQAQKVDNLSMKVWIQNKDAALEIPISPAKFSFGFFNGQAVLVLGGIDGTVTLLDQDSGKKINQFSVFSGNLASVAVSGDGKTLAASACPASRLGCDQLILWDMSTNQNIEVKADIISLKVGAITSLAFSLDGKKLAFGTRDSRIYFYDLTTGGLSQAVTQGVNLQGNSLDVTSLSFSPGEVGVLAAGFRDGRIALWSEDTLDPIGEYVNRMNGVVSGLVFSRSSTDNLWTLASASDNGEVWVWQVDKKSWLQRACQLAGRTLSPDEMAQFIPSTTGLTAQNFCPNISP
jgi:WD40 repeat protein